MAISYEDALATLQSMFSGQGYTAHQLDAVLRHYGGHMEHTVETLLSHGEGTPDELIKKLPSLPVGGSAAANVGGGDASSGNAAHNIDADEELARQLAAEDERQARGQRSRGAANRPSQGGMGMASAMGAQRQPPGQRRPAASTVTAPKPRPAVSPPKPPAGTKGRGTPTVLPDDFLRIPGKKYPVSNATPNGVSGAIASATGTGGAGQMMTDEQLARMLQDELFQEELRNNPEFSHLAGRRNPRAAGMAGGSRVAAGGQTSGRSTYGGGGGGVGWGERTDFFDRLSELGDNAKRRFQDLAASWNDPNAQASRRGLFGGGGHATANRGGGNESRGLLSNDLNMDEEEEEMDFIGGDGGGSRNIELNDVGGGSSGGGTIDWSGDKKKD